MQIVRAVTRAAVVVTASYRILVTTALGLYLLNELKEHGIKGLGRKR